MIESDSDKIRILVVDDEIGVINSYKNIFNLQTENEDLENKLQNLSSKLYGTNKKEIKPSYDVVFRQQSDEAVQAVRMAIHDNRPFAMAFLDVRMPPGPDGVWAAERIRELDPLINIVIVTAYSDLDPAIISSRVQPLDKLLYVQKPFHTPEIEQFAAALGSKWKAEKKLLDVNRLLHDKVEEQTADLKLTNAALEQSISQYQESEIKLKQTQKELQINANDLEGTTIALRQMVKKNESDQKDLEGRVLFSVNEMIKPYTEKLKECDLDEESRMYCNIIENNIDEIAAPFMKGLAYKYFRLSPKEIHIANLIKQGKNTKKIAELLNITQRGVEFHRNKIREKIGIKHSKAQLRKVLMNLEVEFIGK